MRSEFEHIQIPEEFANRTPSKIACIVLFPVSAIVILFFDEDQAITSEDEISFRNMT